jgi:hypothetical protein
LYILKISSTVKIYGINYEERHIARVIKLNDWPLLPMPSPPETDEATSQFELDLIIEDYKEEQKIVIRENVNIRYMSSQMFAQILVHLCEESLAAVKEADDWNEIELHHDAVLDAVSLIAL